MDEVKKSQDEKMEAMKNAIKEAMKESWEGQKAMNEGLEAKMDLLLKKKKGQ